MPYVYILKSLKNGRYYIGSTNNIVRRFKEHNEGKSKYTKNIRPLKIVFKQKFSDLNKARSTEYKLKKLKSKEIIVKIIKDKEIKFVK